MFILSIEKNIIKLLLCARFSNNFFKKVLGNFIIKKGSRNKLPTTYYFNRPLEESKGQPLLKELQLQGSTNFLENPLKVRGWRAAADYFSRKYPKSATREHRHGSLFPKFHQKCNARTLPRIKFPEKPQKVQRWTTTTYHFYRKSTKSETQDTYHVSLSQKIHKKCDAGHSPRITFPKNPQKVQRGSTATYHFPAKSAKSETRDTCHVSLFSKNQQKCNARTPSASFSQKNTKKCNAGTPPRITFTENPSKVRRRTTAAYHFHQKCSGVTLLD